MQVYVRTCQECGLTQERRPSVTYQGESYRDVPCIKCQSSSLDFGAFVDVESREDIKKFKKFAKSS